MYFENIEKINLQKLIQNEKLIYAHLLGEKQEPLQDHLDLSLKYLENIVTVKNLDHIFKNFENIFMSGFSNQGKELYKDMIFNTIFLHDIGKINCNFQYRKMNNLSFEKAEGLSINNSNHSMLSALIYLNYYFNKIKQLNEKIEKERLRIFMVMNAYIISKHHGSLDSLEHFREKMVECDGEGKKLYTDNQALYNKTYTDRIVFDENNHIMERMLKKIMNRLKDYEKEERQISVALYIYERFLMSILIACDYYATYEFKRGCEIIDFGEINEMDLFLKQYENTTLYKKIRQYEKEKYTLPKDLANVKEINVLRTELFLDAEQTLLHNTTKNIFYLEAPTGSGKSNTSMNLSFQIIKQCPSINKIFYIYPFNTLVEQNLNILNETFENSEAIHHISVINSVVPIKTDKKLEKKKNLNESDSNENSDVLEYEEALLDRIFLHYPLVLTTHVSIFRYLFGISKDDLFPLWQIANSVLVLDEIQSYKNSIWKEIIMFLQKYGELLNIKIIIMSATLPYLGLLLDGKHQSQALIMDREKYYSHPLFKNRTQLDFSLLDEKEDLKSILFEHILETSKKCKGNILIEFIKKDTAQEFYDELIEYQNNFYEDIQFKIKQIELITGDDNSVDRNTIIHKIKQNKHIILIGTQVIEAGIDIDMDIGYKDIAMIDADEQFLGRINRSCRKTGCKVYFFDLDSAAPVYKNDVRKNKDISLSTKNMRTILINKNFKQYYEYVLEILNQNALRNNEKNFHDFIYDQINQLDFRRVEDRMKLIDEHKHTVFLNRRIVLESEEVLEGKKIWNQYKALLKNEKLEYAEKKVKISQITSKLSYFIYQVSATNFSYNERIGDMYYIENGDNYFTNGKFDRRKLNNDLFIG